MLTAFSGSPRAAQFGSFEPGEEGQFWQALTPMAESVNRCYPHTVDADGAIVLTTYEAHYATDPDTGKPLVDQFGSKIVDYYYDPVTSQQVNPATTGDYQRWNYFIPPCGKVPGDTRGPLKNDE